MNKRTLNYASKMQSILMQDIEVTEFNSLAELILFVDSRFDFDDDATVYVYFFNSKNNDYLDAKITRYPEEIICYLQGSIIHNVDVTCFNVYECESYFEAIEYLRSYFEVSSIFNP
jgi:hypothetical protein